mmetsp:Transcript_4532/g.8071  ORF Transcript_4532/g.8071 Transcript_4532/m.8071 type:complete len:1405 (-) Transcript_4532:383-4597(-)
MVNQSMADSILAEFTPDQASDKESLETLTSRLFDAGDHLATGKILRKEFTETLAAIARWLGHPISPNECRDWFAGADEKALGNMKHHAFQTVVRKYVLAQQDQASLWVLQDVMVLIKVQWEDLTYKVKWRGDAEMQAVFGSIEPQIGRLSPPVPLTGLSPALTEVPTKATHCTFAYPLVDLQVDAELPEGDARRAFFSYGGFVYLDFEGNVLQINALSPHRFKEDCCQLYLSSQHPAPAEFLATELRRLQPMGHAMLKVPEAGHRFAWLSPEDALDLPLMAPHGAFVFFGGGQIMYNCVLCQNESCCPGTSWGPQDERAPAPLEHLLAKAKAMLHTPLQDPICHKLFTVADEGQHGQLNQKQFCQLFGKVMGLFTEDVIDEETEDWYGKVETNPDANRITEDEFAFAVRSYLKSNVALEQIACVVNKAINAPRPKASLAPSPEAGEPLTFPAGVRALWLNRHVKAQILVQGGQYSIVSIPGVDWKLPNKQGHLSPLHTLEGLDAVARERAGIPKTATQVMFAHPMAEVQPITKLTYSAVHSFLALGGFIYIDEENAVLRVCGLSVSNFYKGRPINFASPVHLTAQSVAALQASDLLQPSTHLGEVLFGVTGLHSLAWLPGRMATQQFKVLVNGCKVRHGAFVCLYPTPLGWKGTALAVLCKRPECCGALWDQVPGVGLSPVYQRPSSAVRRKVDESAVKYALKNSRQILDAGTPAAEGLLWRGMFAAAGTEGAGKLHRPECKQVVQIIADQLRLQCPPGKFDALFWGLDEKRKGFLVEDEFVHLMEMLTLHRTRQQPATAGDRPARALPVWPVVDEALEIVVDADLQEYTLTFPTTDEESDQLSGPLSAVSPLLETTEWLQARGVPALARFVALAYPMKTLSDTFRDFATPAMQSLATVGALLYLSGEHEVLSTQVLLASADSPLAKGPAPPLGLSAPISFPPLHLRRAAVQAEPLLPQDVPSWAPTGTDGWAWLPPQAPLLTSLGHACPHGGFLFVGPGADQGEAWTVLCNRWQCCGPTWKHSNGWKREVSSKKDRSIQGFIRVAESEILEIDPQQFQVFTKELFGMLDEYCEGYLDRSDAFVACARWAAHLGVPFSSEDFMELFSEDLDDCSQEVTEDQLRYCLQVLMQVKMVMWRMSREQPTLVKQGGKWRTSPRVLFCTPLDLVELGPAAAYRFADGRYRVQNATKIHPLFDAVRCEGFMSPPQELTVDSQGRAQASIPKRARYYSYVYPIDQQPLKLHLMKALVATQDTDPRVGLLLNGGFVYLDATQKQVLASSALYSRPPPTNKEGPVRRMFLAPPAALPQETYLELERSRRLHFMPLPFLPDLGSWEEFSQQEGKWYMAWIPPLSSVESAPGLPHEARKHGAFVCIQKQGGLVTEAVYYGVICQRLKCCRTWWEDH